MTQSEYDRAIKDLAEAWAEGDHRSPAFIVLTEDEAEHLSTVLDMAEAFLVIQGNYADHYGEDN